MAFIEPMRRKQTQYYLLAYFYKLLLLGLYYIYSCCIWGSRERYVFVRYDSINYFHYRCSVYFIICGICDLPKSKNYYFERTQRPHATLPYI